MADPIVTSRILLCTITSTAIECTPAPTLLRPRFWSADFEAILDQIRRRQLRRCDRQNVPGAIGVGWVAIGAGASARWASPCGGGTRGIAWNPPVPRPARALPSVFTIGTPSSRSSWRRPRVRRGFRGYARSSRRSSGPGRCRWLTSVHRLCAHVDFRSAPRSPGLIASVRSEQDEIQRSLAPHLPNTRMDKHLKLFSLTPCARVRE